jgi:hypothetical protein
MSCVIEINHQIKNITYGTDSHVIDVTSTMLNKIKNNLTVVINNDLFNCDPKKFYNKTLIINFVESDLYEPINIDENTKVKFVCSNFNTNSNKKNQSKIYIYFHICQINNWIEIVTYIYELILTSGLIDIIDELCIGVLGNDIIKLKQILSHEKVRIVYISNNLNEYERPTLYKLYDRCQYEECKVLYIHSKGVTRPGVASIVAWLKYLCYFNIERYYDCIKILDNYDICGTEWMDFVGITDPKHRYLGDKYISDHFRGNFFWSNSYYIRKLPKNIGDHYIDPELWIGLGMNVCEDENNKKVYNFYDSKIFLFGEIIDENEYRYKINNKVIWIMCDLVSEISQKCLKTWIKHNPKWKINILNKNNLSQFVDTDEIYDDSLISLAILKKYGGVVVDGTVYCHESLDNWLNDTNLFFFSKHEHDHMISNWFIACNKDNYIINKLYDNIDTNTNTKELYYQDNKFRDLWDLASKMSVTESYFLQNNMFKPISDEIKKFINLAKVPVSKLTYEYDINQYFENCVLDFLLNYKPSYTIGSIGVSTENLGDHIQIIASNRLLELNGLVTEIFIDRDNGLCHDLLKNFDKKILLVLNGWYKNKSNGLVEHWPPNKFIEPIFTGFHINDKHCLKLLSIESINYYKRFEPIGCRDIHTMELLKSKNIDCYLSHCLTLTFDKRESLESQNKIIISSRDKYILDLLPDEIKLISHYINHYSDTNDFMINMNKAKDLLEYYKKESKLVITTFLHCALPCIAMGIPVIVFYPNNDDINHQFDVERFSSLASITHIYSFDDITNNKVNWNPEPIDIDDLKKSIMDNFNKLIYDKLNY